MSTIGVHDLEIWVRRSLKIIESDTIRKLGYGFLLATMAVSVISTT